jgi:hypothetical protein
MVGPRGPPGPQGPQGPIGIQVIKKIPIDFNKSLKHHSNFEEITKSSKLKFGQ